MTYKRTARLLASGLLLGLFSMPAAQAAGYINGSVSVIGGFDCGGCIATGNDFVVSRLMFLEAANPAIAASGSGSFAGLGGSPVVPVRAIELVNPPAQPGQFEVDGFTITIQGVRNVARRPFVCFGGVCQDSLRALLWGEVAGSGYRPTGLVGIWTGQGSCLGRGGVCTSEPSASWSASFSAVRVAEPAATGLWGLGLLVLGVFARNRARQAALTTAASG
jgi:hypothetical protein